MSDQQPPYTPPPGYEEYARPAQPYAGGPAGPGQPGQHGPPGQYGGTPGPVRPTSVAAVVGFVLAFLVAPVGVVVSAFGISDTRGGRKSGRGLAIAGVVIGVVLTVVLAVVVVAAVVFAQRAVQAGTDIASQLETLAPTDLPSGLPTDLSDLGVDVSGDVVVDDCYVDDTGTAYGDVTVTNSSDTAGSYTVNLYAYDADGTKVGELGAVSDSVEPGDSVEAQAMGYADEGTEIASCEVAQAFRG